MALAVRSGPAGVEFPPFFQHVVSCLVSGLAFPAVVAAFCEPASIRLCFPARYLTPNDMTDGLVQHRAFSGAVHLQQNFDSEDKDATQTFCGRSICGWSSCNRLDRVRCGRSATAARPG